MTPPLNGPLSTPPHAHSLGYPLSLYRPPPVAFHLPCRDADAMRGIIPIVSTAVVLNNTVARSAAAELNAESTSVIPNDVDEWWQARADEAMATLLRLEHRRLVGTTITKQTGPAMRLRPSRVQPISQISADGQVFPTDPAEFKAEVLCQARELYAGRPGVQMDWGRLRTGSQLGAVRSACTPDFRTLMHHHLSPSTLYQALGSPPTIPEIITLLRRGSTATSLNELPRSVLRHLPGHGIAALHSIFHQLATGAPSYLLNAVPHLPLRKEPTWLVRNSRPVLLEPFVRRLQATAVLRRMHARLELEGDIPSEMFAYRRQQPSQQAGAVSRRPGWYPCATFSYKMAVPPPP